PVRQARLRLCADAGLRTFRRGPAAAPQRPAARAAPRLADPRPFARDQRGPVRGPGAGLRPRSGRASVLRPALSGDAPAAEPRRQGQAGRRGRRQGCVDASGGLSRRHAWRGRVAPLPLPGVAEPGAEFMLTMLRRAVLALIALAMFAPGPAWAQWLRAETDHFIIYGDTSERALRTYAEKIERFDFLLRSYYPIAVDHEIPKLDIYLAGGRRDMLKAAPGICASVGGFYSPNSSRIHAVVDTESRMGDH